MSCMKRTAFMCVSTDEFQFGFMNTQAIKNIFELNSCLVAHLLRMTMFTLSVSEVVSIFLLFMCENVRLKQQNVSWVHQ